MKALERAQTDERRTAMKILYTAEAAVEGGRGELFVVGYAACFQSTLQGAVWR